MSIVELWLTPPERGLSPNARVHRFELARLRKEARAEARIAAANIRPGAREPLFAGPVIVSVHVCWPVGRRRMDVDNLIAALKPTWDGFTDGMLWQDDRQIADIRVAQVTGWDAPGRVSVTVREAAV